MAAEHWVEIELGTSKIVTWPAAPTSVAVTDPGLVEVQGTGDPKEVQVKGLQLGSTDVVATFDGRSPFVYEVTVIRPLKDL